MKETKFSVGVWTFGSCLDRFCAEGYHKPISFSEKIKMASKVQGLDGVEVHHNGDFDMADVENAKSIMENSNLEVTAIDCEIFGDRKFKKGALTSTDENIRQDAIDVVKEAAELTKQFDASLVNLWPGAEGFDYPFHVDHTKRWELFLDSIEQCVSAYPDVTFSLEYKPREPRVRSTLNNAGRTLFLVNELNKENLGVTIDFGHSLMAKENPAEAAALIQKYNKLFHIHLNDNSRDWDDDLMVNTYHLWETLEFIYYLDKTDYQGWIGFDVFPRREDQIKSVEYNIKSIKKMFNYIKDIDDKKLRQSFHNTDALSAYEFLTSKILK